MLWKTHLSTSAIIGLPILAIRHDILTGNMIKYETGIHVIAGVGMSAIAIGGLLFGSLLPDIDEPNSQIGRRFKVVSEFLYRTVGHRGVVHSAIALFGLMIITNLFKLIGIVHLLLGCITFGFGLHLCEDYFSYMGIKWLCPIIQKDFKFPVYSMRYEVGGVKEKIIFIISLVILIGEIGILFFNFNLFKFFL